MTLSDRGDRETSIFEVEEAGNTFVKPSNADVSGTNLDGGELQGVFEDLHYGSFELSDCMGLSFYFKFTEGARSKRWLVCLGTAGWLFKIEVRLEVGFV